jgi:hypothetical protein
MGLGELGATASIASIRVAVASQLPMAETPCGDADKSFFQEQG